MIVENRDWGRAIPFMGILFLRILGIVSLQCTYVTSNKFVQQICNYSLLPVLKKISFILLPIGGRELASSVEVNQCLVLRFSTNTLLHTNDSKLTIIHNYPHCFIFRPSDSTVSEDAGIEPRARICKGLKSIPRNRFRQAGNRFLGSFKGQIWAQHCCYFGIDSWTL